MLHAVTHQHSRAADDAVFQDAVGAERLVFSELTTITSEILLFVPFFSLFHGVEGVGRDA
jgi:hypothetical protein